MRSFPLARAARAAPLAALLSVAVPGLGQALAGRPARAITLFTAFVFSLITALWFGQQVWFASPVVFAVWCGWDAWMIARGAGEPRYRPGAPTWIPVVAWLVLAYGVGWQVTGIEPLALYQNRDRAASILGPMTRPDLFAPNAQIPDSLRDECRIVAGAGFSTNGIYIACGMIETVALALLATALGALLGFPLSFLAARNLMATTPVGTAIYAATRAVLNVVRSIESLILAIVFVKIVGLGPFAGMLAIMLHTAAALGKLYSEIIESIDPGPIEAIRATGADWLQIVRYAVVPQIVPQFLSQTFFRWDINIRSSTIIGYVGGGGIGQFLTQWVTIGDFRAVSAAFITIALVVLTMDFASARIRERVEDVGERGGAAERGRARDAAAGRSPRVDFSRSLRRIGIAVVAVGIIALSVRYAEVDFVRLLVDAPKAGDMVQRLLEPDILARATITTTLNVDFPVPCGSAPVAARAADERLSLSAPCGAPREEVTVSGQGIPRGTRVYLRWRLAEGNPLGIDLFDADADGHYSQSTLVRPILTAVRGVPASIEAELTTPVGGWVFSAALREVVDSMFVTIFIALLATTLATLIAAPLSFLAARNITRRGAVGTLIYYAVRAGLNIARAFDPLVMAIIFALIVGFGKPFAGVLALLVVTVASIGRMFADIVEDIDPGPIEAVNATGADGLQNVRYAVVPQIIPNFLSFIIYHWDINIRISTIIGFVGAGGIGLYLFERLNSFEYHKASTALLSIVIVVWTLDFISAQVRKRLI